MDEALLRREPELQIVAEPEPGAGDRVQVVVGGRLDAGARQGGDDAPQLAQGIGGVSRSGKRGDALHPPREVPATDVGSEQPTERTRPPNGARAPESAQAVSWSFEFIALTAARDAEVRGAVWNEMDQGSGVWTVPASRMRKRRSCS